MKFNEIVLSIDSYKPIIIEYCLKNGFKMINDISGGGSKFENILLRNPSHNISYLIN